MLCSLTRPVLKVLTSVPPFWTYSFRRSASPAASRCSDGAKTILYCDKSSVGPRKIHGDVAVMERVVDELNVLAQVEKFVGLHRLLQRPFVVVGVKDAGFAQRPWCP